MQALKPAAVAEILEIDIEKVYRLINSGDLVAIDVSITKGPRPRWRILEEELHQFMEQRSSKPAKAISINRRKPACVKEFF